MNNRLMIVDDDDDFVRLLYHRCQSIGAEVWSPSSAAEAIKLLVESRVDLVCLDTDLPEGIGCQIAEHLSTRNEPNKIPLIVLTESEDLSTMRACSRIGGYYVHKSPTFWNRLKPVFQEFLEFPT